MRDPGAVNIDGPSGVSSSRPDLDSIPHSFFPRSERPHLIHETGKRYHYTIDHLSIICFVKASMGGTVLIIDDDPQVCDLLQKALTGGGHEADHVSSGEPAVQALHRNRYDFFVIDLRIDGMSEFLQKVKKNFPQQAFVATTDSGTGESAVDAVKPGGIDDLFGEALLTAVRRAFNERRLPRERCRESRFSSMIGKSGEMREVFQLIRKVSESAANILITGESGTGKEMVAKAIHCNSSRKDQPFIAVNCAAIPEPLLESELFGHVKGAFTDAQTDKKGMFEAAEGGTLFLDEIGEVPVTLQPKLLRAIEDKAVRKVGSTETVSIDIRILSATNLELKEAVKTKRFRDDLYYRINVLEIQIPPLRRRVEDIPLLANHFLEKYGRQKGISGFTEEALHLLTHYAWPGNVRELENIIERAVTFTRNNKIGAEDLPQEMIGLQGDQLLERMLTKQVSLAELEREYLERVLQSVGGNKLKAAQILQIDRKTLYRKLSQSRNRGSQKEPLSNAS